MDINKVIQELNISKSLAINLDHIDGSIDNNISESIFNIARNIASNPGQYLDSEINAEMAQDQAFIAVRDAFIKDRKEGSKQINNNNDIPYIEKKQPEVTATAINQWTFKGLSKNDLYDIKKTAKEVLDNANDMVEIYKATNETSEFKLDFTDFPKPENYKNAKEIKKGFYEDLTRWFNNEQRRLTLDIGKQKENVNEKLDEIKNQIVNVLHSQYEEFGITREIVAKLYEQTKGDLQSLKEQVYNEATKTKEDNGISDGISEATHGYNTKEISKKIKNLKQKIISSDKITDEKKKEILNKLQDLVIKDSWITHKDLNNILKEISYIDL